MANADVVIQREGAPNPEPSSFAAADLTSANMLAEELSMQIMEGAKSLVDSRKAYNPADTNVDSKNQNDVIRRRGSLSSNSGSESGDKNDDSSIDSDDSNDRPHSNQDSDSDDVTNKQKSNSVSNSISSDSAYDDKFTEDKNNRNRNFERVNGSDAKPPKDGAQSQNVPSDEGSDQDSDNNDTASQSSSDSNQSGSVNMSNLPRRSVYDNKAFQHDENPRPKRAGVTFAVASPDEDDDDDFYGDAPNDESFEDDEKESKKKIDKKEWQRRQDFM